MSLYAQAVSAERAAKIARDMADHEAGIDALQEENKNLRSALHDCVKSLQGYRRELSDGQPCDAEKAALAILTPNDRVQAGEASPATTGSAANVTED